jgi:hypothetical protein
MLRNSAPVRAAMGGAMSLMDLDDPEVAERVAAVGARMSPRLIEVAVEIRNLIQAAVPALRGDERVTSLLEASVRENVDTMMHLLRHGIPPGDIDAPSAALEYSRRLAQREVAASALIRAYRIGQARFLRRCLEDQLGQMGAGRVERAATLEIIERVSEYIDRVVEQVLTAYEQAREEWLQQRGAVFATRVLAVLNDRSVDIAAAESKLGGYPIRQRHLGAVIWSAAPTLDVAPLTMLRALTDAVARRAGCRARPLFVPYDEMTAWLWMPIGDGDEAARTSFEKTLAEGFPSVVAALGEPGQALSGFRRTHQQAVGAQTVALAAGGRRAQLTPFIEVAPLAMMCADLDSARAWVSETLGGLAIDDERHAMLRETTRVFLAAGGSYIATADQLTLHRNTAQYRIRKAEELRGRSFREGRLDVELALLACRWLNKAVLTSVSPSNTVAFAQA